MKLLYFAHIRTRLDLAEEVVDPPETVTTVAELLDWLSTRGPRFEAVLADRKGIRVAVNQDFATPETAVSKGDEVAVFPPVTGG